MDHKQDNDPKLGSKSTTERVKRKKKGVAVTHKTSGNLINSDDTISDLLHPVLPILGSINQRVSDVVAYLSHNPPQKNRLLPVK